MNLPNKLTVARIFFTPIFYLLFIFGSSPLLMSFRFPYFLFLGILWLILEISDVLDGYIARKQGLVSDLGKLMDPFSDVLIRLTFFYCFATVGIYPFGPILIIFWREISITFIRAVLAKTGVTLPAGWAGKFKAIFYFLTSGYGMIICILMAGNLIPVAIIPGLVDIGFYLMILTTVVCVGSFIPYFIGFVKTDYMQKHIKE
ncbi:MAG: CDP-alcohol phosphatidyltransferase family protein [Spirochaetia bacterium]